MNTFIMARENNLSETELAAILLFIYSENKTFAWSNTLGINNLSPNKTMLASQWFKNQKTQNAIYLIKKQIEKDEEMFEVEKEPKENRKQYNTDPDIDITSENIKDILQSEFKKISDPDKRAVILMKIADFVGLKNSDAEDPLTPTIYLPSRCSTCNQLKNKG